MCEKINCKMRDGGGLGSRIPNIVYQIKWRFEGKTLEVSVLVLHPQARRDETYHPRVTPPRLLHRRRPPAV